MLQQVFAKLNANERMAAIGAGLVLLAFLIGIVLSRGYIGLGGTGVLGVLAAIALLVVYYLKYTSSTINWPAPIPVIAFAIGAVTGVVALLVVIDMLQVLGILATYGGIQYLLAPIVNVVGAGMMAWFTYKEWQAYQATRPAAPPVAAPAPPVAAPPAPPASGDEPGSGV